MPDGTVSCMGRGAGNCALELLLGFLRNPKVQPVPHLEVYRAVHGSAQAREMQYGAMMCHTHADQNAESASREAIDFIKNERHDYADMYSYLMYRE